MGKMKTGILGGVSGKIGNVVGSSWKGIDYLKTLPATYNDAKSDVQINNRSKFQTVVRFLQPLTEVIRIGYKALAVKKSAFNAATSYTYHHAAIGEYPDVSIDFSKVMVSLGSLRSVENGNATSATAGKLNISWDDNSGLGTASVNDAAMVVVYHPILKDAYYQLNIASRADGSAELDLPPSYSGSEVQVYLSFLAIAGQNGSAAKNISDSRYLGVVTIT